MKKINPATINHNRYRLLIDWRTELNPGISTVTLNAQTLRAAKKEVETMVCEGWYLAQILERQNDVGVVDVDTPDDYQWLYRPVLEYRMSDHEYSWHDATDIDWSGDVVTWHSKYKVWTTDLTSNAPMVAHMFGCAE